MKKTIMLFCFVICVAVTAQNLSASGIGAYLSYRGSQGDIDSTTEKYNSTMTHFGGGFLYESDVSSSNFFSYRVNVGIFSYNQDYSLSSDSTGDFSVSGLYTAVDYTMGLKIVSSDAVRIWLGPTLGIGKSLTATYEDANGDTVDGKYNEAFFWLGAAIGGNVHFNSDVSLGLVAGYRLTYNGATFEPDDGGNKITYDGTTAGPYINVSVILTFMSE